MNTQTHYEFTTDRHYNGQQRITVEILSRIESGDPDAVNLIDIRAKFNDHSRNIRGEVTLMFMHPHFTPRQLQDAVMLEYDTGRYY